MVKTVKGVHLIVRIVENVDYIERNVCQILNKTIAVIIFITSLGYKRTSWLGVLNLSVKLTKL